MHKIASYTLIVMALVAPAAAAPAASSGPAKAATSAYERLDNVRLADMLSNMGMTGLLGALADDLAATSPLDSQYARSEMLVCQARALEGRDAAQRAQLLQQAASLLEKTVAAAKPGDDPVLILKSFRYRLRLADIQGNLLTVPQLERLIYLQGGASDRDEIARATETPAKDLAKIHDAITQLMQTWRKGDKTREWMTFGNQAEELAMMIGYKKAQVNLCRAMAITDGAAKKALLSAAIDAAKPIAQQADNDNGLKFWALLLSGQAAREQKLYVVAVDYLKQAVSPEAEPALQVGAQFELTRVLIEKGDFAGAKKQVETFYQTAGQVLGKTGQIPTDVQYALLKNYLYERWAAAVRPTDAKQADQYDLEAQNALLKFVADHSDLQASFFELIASKYRDQQDYSKLNSMILTAVAIQERAKNTADSQTKAQGLLDMVCSRTDASSMGVRPLALMNLAAIYIARRDNAEACKKFMEVAQKHPDSPLAFNAILNAVRTYDFVIAERVESNAPVAPNLRESLIAALELMFSRKDWAARPETQGWFFALAWQYNKLADGAEPAAKAALLDKAVAAFDGVAPGQAEHMEARHLALHCRVDKIASLTDRAAQQKLAGEVVTLLSAYSADAAKAAAQATAEKKDAAAASLREWGAQSDYMAAMMDYDYLDRRPQGNQMLQQLGAKWPGTSILRASAETLIRKKLEEGKIDDAIALVEDFRKNYAQSESQIIASVVEQIQARIKTLRYSLQPADAAELSRYRKAYYKFAQVLYQNLTKTPGAAPGQLYSYRQLLADGTLEGGLDAQAQGDAAGALKIFGEALGLFEQCKAQDDAARTAQAAAIEAKFAQKIQAVQKASGLALFNLASEFLTKELAAYQVPARNVSAAMMLQSMLRASQGAQAAHEQDDAALRTAILNAYAGLAKYLKRGLAIDSVNMWGLARTHVALKQYDKALALFKQLTDGIDRSQHEAMYWQAEYEYCACCLQGFADDKKVMAGLGMRIRQLRLDNTGSTMSGLLPLLNGIQAQAEQKSR